MADWQIAIDTRGLITVARPLNVMKEGLPGATLRRVNRGATPKEARLHVARRIGSQPQAP
jgi:hypothetical protein